MDIGGWLISQFLDAGYKSSMWVNEQDRREDKRARARARARAGDRETEGGGKGEREGIGEERGRGRGRGRGSFLGSIEAREWIR